MTTSELLRKYRQTNPALAEACISQFVRYIPRNCEAAVAEGMTEYAKGLADTMDMVDYNLRKYVVGFQKTLHRVNPHIRLLISYPAGPEITWKIICDIEAAAMKNELFELMPRILQAKAKIRNLIH